MAVILPGDALTSIAAGAHCIRAGGLLGLPTETVYGLAADADNDVAVGRIFAAKGRPASHPLIVHVANTLAVDHYACAVPEFASALMAAFWPGPLTLILPRRASVAAAAAGGQPSIGLRCPAHPVALALLQQGQRRFEFEPPPAADQASTADPDHFWGLAAPSANVFGRVSPTTAAHVRAEFGDDLLILDGGPCQLGIESTIIDCTRGQPVLLRPGAITPAQVQAACGLKVLLKKELPAQAAPAPRAAGTLDSHYAPRARVRLLRAPDLQLALDAVQGARQVASAPDAAADARPVLAVWSRCEVMAVAGALHHAMPDDAVLAARQLFAQLRAFDALGVTEIWVETPPDDSAWDAVRDRLQRAAH